MLSQEIIYQHLQARSFSSIIIILYENGNLLNKEPSIDFAIDIFINELFMYINTAVKEELDELNHDLDMLLLCHTEKKYRLKNDQVLELIRLLYKRAPIALLYSVAKDFPQNTTCEKIIYSFEKIQRDSDKRFLDSSRESIVEGSSLNNMSQKFETKIRNDGYIYWVKVFLRSSELLHLVANHIKKLPSVNHVNITKQGNGHSDLTIYGRQPFTIYETENEVILTLENYFSRSPADPIFKNDVISGISDIAYFEILDYMIRLGVGLEGFRELSVNMNEERYRDYFANYLDSLSTNHTATAETFHGIGKSDILIRNREKEILLVAECKLWNGPSYLRSAIDQLFNRYITWRDGKAALLIFNTKAIDFSKIMRTAVETLKSHDLFVSYVEKRKETSHSFLFCNHKDREKVVKLELILFNFL